MPVQRRLVLTTYVTPTVYDGTRHTPWSRTDRYNDVLDRYSEAAKAIAEREGLKVIDLHAVTTEALAQVKKDDSEYTFAPDGVHPQEDLISTGAIKNRTIVSHKGENRDHD